MASKQMTINRVSSVSTSSGSSIGFRVHSYGHLGRTPKIYYFIVALLLNSVYLSRYLNLFGTYSRDNSKFAREWFPKTIVAWQMIGALTYIWIYELIWIMYSPSTPVFCKSSDGMGTVFRIMSYFIRAARMDDFILILHNIFFGKISKSNLK